MLQKDVIRMSPLASNASVIDYGGETIGSTSWPPMGSGTFGNEGSPNAAYQRDINYFPSTGGGIDADLTLDQPSQLCYNAILQRLSPPWNETLFYGGPGGTSC